METNSRPGAGRDPWCSGSMDPDFRRGGAKDYNLAPSRFKKYDFFCVPRGARYNPPHDDAFDLF